MTGKFSDLFKGFFDSEKVAGLLLIVCTVTSLIIANSAIGEGYIHSIHREFDLPFDGKTSIDLFVNDGLMAIFFLLVGLEVERELYIGELADFKKAILPMVAALGGICVPALIHFSFNYGTTTQSGFAIPMATDIAFALGILALVGNRVPVSVKIFLTALAIIDDIGAIVVIALFYTKTIHFNFLLATAGVFAFMLILNRLKVQHLVLYLLLGALLWFLLLKSGIHATIAGVLTAFAVPFNKNDSDNISLKLQHFLHKPAAFIIIPIFALVNTAIPMPSSIIQSLYSPNSLGIVFGLAVGKLVGIFLPPYIMVKTGMANLQSGITWKSLTGIGLLGGIGFTMSMFISNLAFSDSGLVDGSKIAILTGSLISAITGLLLFISSKKVKELY